MKLSKKLLALFLVIAMLASLATVLSGCGDNGDVTEPSNTEPKPTSGVDASGEDTIGASIDLRSTADPSNPETDPYGRYEETVTFTTVRQLDVGANFPEGMDVLSNPIVDRVQETLNVEMELLWYSG